MEKKTFEDREVHEIWEENGHKYIKLSNTSRALLLDNAQDLIDMMNYYEKLSREVH